MNLRAGPEVITLEDGATIELINVENKDKIEGMAPLPTLKNFSVTNSPKHHTEKYWVVSEHETKEEALGAMEEDNEVWEFLFSKKARRLK